MRCPALCPHCGQQCIHELPPLNVPHSGRHDGTHKGRHETAAPPGKQSGHNWPNRDGSNANSIDTRLLVLAEDIEKLPSTVYLDTIQLAKELRAIRTTYLLQRYHGKRKHI